MRPRVIQSIFSGALSLALAAALRSSAATAPVVADSASDSPFLPPNTGGAAAVSDGAPIELHGIMNMPDGMRFSIFDPSKKSASWVRLNERGLPFVVKDYSVVDGSDQVKVDYQGSTLTLGLKAAKITAMATPQMAVGPGAGGPMGRGGNNPITNSVVVNPTPADEAARLQAVVEAVAARRAARNQATQLQQAGGAPPQVMAPATTGQTNLRPRQIQRQQQQQQQK